MSPDLDDRQRHLKSDEKDKEKNIKEFTSQTDIFHSFSNYDVSRISPFKNTN